ncbi:hypothetical protein [Clostridium lacusfryxellense]|uniref:hypothetical protein n=1 Tax=Clostridium lacusfryxellense TaxID=205328 RepID=UPI001C0D3AE9|nr:hypothetical protein [Clostridium lacusfryxellense]MBU3112014.1 hypothetical protein [Clostridium lacusfryxellense]
MADDREFRIENIEENVKTLQAKEDKHTERDNIAAVTTAETKIFVTQIFEKLDDLKISLAEDIQKSTVTEKIALNLVVVTDTVVKGLAEVNAKVTAIEQLPIETARVAAANAKKMKFMIWQWLLGSGIAVAVGLYKGIIWLSKALNN